MPNQNEKKQQLEQDRIRAVADQLKPKCSVCGRYKDKKTNPQCFCSSGSPGVDSGPGSESGKSAGKDPATPDPVTGSTEDSTDEMSSVFFPRHPGLATEKLDPVMILGLLKNNLIKIRIDRDKGIFKIKLLYDPKLLPQELKNEWNKYIDAIQNEFNEFKKKHKVSDDCMKIKKDESGNVLSLRISLPTWTLFNTFIKQLEKKHLIPMEALQQESQNQFKPSAPTPKPTPFTSKKSADEEKEEGKKSIRPRLPTDRFRTRG